MTSKFSLAVTVILAAFVSSCETSYDPLEDYEQLQPATILDAPEPVELSELAERGQYIVELLGCEACHTDGALAGAPRPDRKLAGSSIGIAYSNPLSEKYPGILYPRNLTPDAATGLGNRTDKQLAAAISGATHGSDSAAVMPRPAYAKMTAEDVDAVIAYLRAIPAVRHRVPDHVRPGQPATSPYIHFGIYRSRQ